MGKFFSWDAIRECFSGMAIRTSKNVNYERKTVRIKGLTSRKVTRQAETECLGKGKQADSCEKGCIKKKKKVQPMNNMERSMSPASGVTRRMVRGVNLWSL